MTSLLDGARPEEAQQATDALAAAAQARLKDQEDLRRPQGKVKRLRDAAKKRGGGKK
jgi:hypothetical protein